MFKFLILYSNNIGELRFCPQCGENRYLKMKISIPILIVLLILGIFLGLIYIVYCHLQKQQCAACGTPAEMMQPPRMENING